MVRIHQRAEFQAIPSVSSPGNALRPEIWPVLLSQIVPKFKKSTDQHQKLVSCEGGQDTSPCKISAHSLYVFSRKCLETPDLTRFTKSKWRQKEENQQTVTIILSVLKVIKIHHHAKFQPIPSMRSPGIARKPQIWPVSLSQSGVKRRKINRPWP